MLQQTPKRTLPLLHLLLLVLLVAAACRSSPDPPPLTDDPALDAFAREVEADLEAHAWRDLIAAADPDHYRTQVTEHGMPEPQYVAELFGLHRVDNTIKRGQRVEWSDLERIEAVGLEEISTTAGAGRQLVGTVTLSDGSTLELSAQVDREEGRYVLTGGVG